MKIRDWDNYKEQKCTLGKHRWAVARLIELSKELPIKEIPLDYLNIYNTYDKLTLRDMVMHINAINNCNLDYPIILDEDGELLDGRHRIMKALLLGKDTIKVVRFDENPIPCEILEN